MSNPMLHSKEFVWKYKKFFLLYIIIFLLIQIPIHNLKLPVEKDGWMSDIAYNWNRELNGNMAEDIPWGSTWSTGRGKSFYLIHHLFYRIFGLGLFQGRIVTFIAGIFLLFLVFKWAAKNISRDVAILSAILLMISFSFWPFLPFVSQDITHCLFFFIAFCFIFSAVSFNKDAYYFAAGFFSALSVENSHRGIQIVICVYLAHIIFSQRKTFFKRSAFLLTGSFVAFIIWFLVNVLPMGVGNYFRYHIVISRTEQDPQMFKMLFNEINRFFLYIKTQRHLAKIEVVYWIILLFAFFKYRLKMKYPKVSKFLISWLLITFIVVSLTSQLDAQIFPVYVLLYSIYISILCGISLHELFQHKRKMAYSLLFLILFTGIGCPIGRVAIYSYYRYIKAGYGMEGYFERLRSKVDLTKNIIGEVEYWYAFTDAQYYGGLYYLDRVISVLHELKPADGYNDGTEKAKALLKVLQKRKIEYIVSSTNPNYTKDAIARYFPGRILPEKNFKLIDKFENRFNWNRGSKTDPHCNIEIYQVISYEL